MSASQRRKGRCGELEVVTIARKHELDARRTWENASSPDREARCCDVMIGSKKVQVKRRKRAWSDLYLALANVELVACRSDNTPWLVVMRFEDWIRSIDSTEPELT